MIQLIIGEKGKGKTKILLGKANSEFKERSGNVVYIDKSNQHMYELNNRVRLIDITKFPVTNFDHLFGFLCGLISRDSDLQLVYLDSFLKIANLTPENVGPALDKIIRISDLYQVDFVLSISIKAEELPEVYKEYVINE